MVKYTLIDHRNDVIKCSKLKWNHKPQAAWKIVVDLFFTIFFFCWKNQKQNNRHCVTCYVISVVYTLIDHSSQPISTRGFALLL